MVEATDFAVEVTTTEIPDSKAVRLTCSACDWMETAGSASVATRKKNAHVKEHRAATTGAPGVPTIMDAIEGSNEIPPEAFRDSVPVVAPALCEVRNELGVQCRLLAGHVDLKGHRFPDSSGEPVPVREAIEEVSAHWTPAATSELRLHSVSFVAEPPDPTVGVYPIEFGPTEELDEKVITDAMDQVAGVPMVPKESFHFPRVEDVRASLEKDAEVPVFSHTRTSTGREGEPDFCHECSDAIQDWVPWPCPNIVDRGKLAVALTRSRLEDQKGPSDFDKDLEDSEWHRVRAESVSATLAAKLGSAADVDYLIAREVRERLGGARFRGNAYTRWGRDREPFLEQAGLERHGIVGEDHLFHSRANPRHVASPDGIAIHPESGEVALGEYKTSGKELTWAKVVSNGYYDQVQWQLYVLEASHCWLMWEWRHGEGADYSTYVPQVGGEHLIMRDDTRIAELVARADRFLEVLDEARGRVLQTPDAEPVDPQLYWLVDQHLAAKAEAKRAEEQLREYCEATGVKSVEIEGVAKVSYSWGSPRQTFDRERFESDHPGLYDAYKIEGTPPERPTLRVTPAKGDDEQ